MIKNELLPKIRFKEFEKDEAWEQRKFGDIFEISQGLQIAISERFLEPGENRFFYITNEFLRNDYEGKYYVYNPSGNVVCNKDDILMTRTGNTGIVVTDVQGCFHNNFFKIKYDKQNFDKYFICKFLSSPMMQKRILNSAGSSTIPDLSHKSFYKLDGFFPKIEEQKRISALFSDLDNLITLHQRKLEKLKNLKEAYLSEMFPKEGEKYPKRRFDGFTEAWEQRKLGELGSVAMNKRIFKDQTRESGDVPFYKIGTFGREPDAYISRKLFEEYKAKYPYPEVGDILISASGSIGRTVEYTGEDEYFQDSNIVWVKHDGRIDNSFLKQFYKIVEWEGLEGSTIKRLYNKNILETLICLPKLEEQQRIGTFFANIDKLITLHQRKLEKLKDTKKAYLNEMFV